VVIPLQQGDDSSEDDDDNEEGRPDYEDEGDDEVLE
jgi:hypothetical protein